MNSSQLSSLDSSFQAIAISLALSIIPWCQTDVVMQNYSSADWPVLMNTSPPNCPDAGTSCSDAIVPVTSALDELSASNVCTNANNACDGPGQASLVQGAIHGAGTLDIGFPGPYLQEMANVSQGTIDLLNASTTGPQFGALSSYPNAPPCPATFAGLTGTSGSVEAKNATKRSDAPRTATTTVAITAPADGTIVTPGQTLNVTVSESATSGYSAIALVGTAIGWMGSQPAGASVSFVVTMPSVLPTGTYSITAISFPTGANGTPAVSQPVNLLVEPSSTPVSLSASPSQIVLNVGDQMPLIIAGSMADGSSETLTKAPQMTFTSDTPATATVSAEGVVAGVAGGSAHVTAELGNVSVTVPVSVNPPPATPCAYTLNAPSANIGGAGGQTQFTVTTNLTTCSWAAVSWVPWVSVTAGGTGIGTSGVAITVSLNPSSTSRSGNVQVAGQSFTVNQGPAPPPSLLITKLHTGPFAPGQQGASYSVVVTNSATAGPTVGVVTVTEMPPSTLTLVSMSGTGWACSGSTCTRSDSLTTGAGYPAITVTANVAANATSPLFNQASVSGGGSPTATVNDPATITAGDACDVGGHGTVGIADIQLMINDALGISPAVNDLSQDGAVTVADIQIVIAGALGMGCSGG